MFYEKTTVIERKEIRAVKWYDNCTVTQANTFEGVNFCILLRNGTDQASSQFKFLVLLSFTLTTGI